MRKTLAVFLLFGSLALGACQSVTPNARLAVACDTYGSTLNVLVPYKSEMTENQIRTVDRVVTTVSPVCKKGESVKNYPTALAVVSEGLRDLARVEAQVKESE